MNINLTGKRAIVCGSTQGIGKAAAIELAALGCSVTLVARNGEALTQVRDELYGGDGQQHGYLVVDFSHPMVLKEKVTGFLKENSPIHILVNNTGGPAGGLIIDAELEEFVSTFSQHLICNHILVQAVVPGMKEEGYGRIINIISTSVKQPIPGLGVSNTVRGAVASWSKTLSGELAPFGITVNNILPGFTKTARLDSLILAKSRKEGKSVEEITNEMIAEVPAARFGKPSELGAVIAFLATPAAAFVNGVSIPVDGGRTGSL